jgi:predicted 3-demethylubiquinone-9 3-methyltransferase (glyoxalase superfamily)
MQKISPFLWFDTQAQEAAEFYVSLFDDSKVTDVSHYPDGRTLGVSFVLNGLEYQAMNAGPQFPFTEAISFFVRAETQEEIDDLWERLTSGGGEPGNCGWLKDKFGLSWQVVPPILGELLSDSDGEKAGRAMQAMLAMHKIDIAELQAAFDGV